MFFNPEEARHFVVEEGQQFKPGEIDGKQLFRIRDTRNGNTGPWVTDKETLRQWWLSNQESAVNLKKG